MSRPLAALLALLVLAVGLAVWLMGGGEEAAPVPTETDTPAVEPAVEEGPTEVEERRVHPGMAGVFPWREFQEDFDLLMQPDPTGPTNGGMHPDAVTAEKMAEPIFTLRLEQATINEIVADLGRQAEGTGVRIYTREPYFSDTMRYDIHASKKSLWQMFDILTDLTNRQLKCYSGDGEVCLGTTYATMRARDDAVKRKRREREEREAQTDLLDATFRPDFDGADAEKIAIAMTAQTGVQVLMHELVWEKHLAMTWRGGETTLRKALVQFTKDLDATFRVHEGRVYILPIL